MFASVLLRPALHGAMGPLDEIISLLPVVIGVALLLYLYFSSRKAKTAPKDPAQPGDEQNEL